MTMDPTLLALTLELQEKARRMTQSDNLEMQFAAADMLDYLGACLDEAKQTAHKSEH